MMTQHKIPNRPLGLSLISKRVQEKWKSCFEFSQNQISLEHWERMTKKTIYDMTGDLHKSIQVRRIKNIRKFTLDLRGSQQELDEDITFFLTEILQSLTQLQKLSISFKNSLKVSEDVIQTIGTSINKRLTDLRDLSLDISFCEKLTNKTLGDLGSKIGHPLSKLKSLSFASERCWHLTEQGLKTFGSNLTFGLRRLVHLKLDFAWCSLSRSEGFEGLMTKIFQRMKLLRSLDLDIAGYGSSPSGYRELKTSEFWRPLPELQYLKIKFNQSQILKDPAILSLLSGVSNYLLNLKSLDLSFEGCGKISDGCLKNLDLKSYQNLTLLRQFTINLLECPLITGKGLEVLSTQIAKNMTHIEQLDLSFGHFESRELFIDDNLERLGTNVSQLRGLVKLVVRFYNCKMITDRGLKVLGQQIAQNLQNLKVLTLVFHKCPKVTKIGKESLENLLVAIPEKEFYTD